MVRDGEAGREDKYIVLLSVSVFDDDRCLSSHDVTLGNLSLMLPNADLLGTGMEFIRNPKR
jgi:hypothetical protein